MGHLCTFEEVVESVWSFWLECAETQVPGVVICEDFARGNTAVEAQLQTIQTIGAIRAITHALGGTIVLHYPASRRGWIPVAKEMVRSQGYSQSSMHHAIDAIAHLLVEVDRRETNWDKQYWLRKVIQSGD